MNEEQFRREAELLEMLFYRESGVSINTAGVLSEEVVESIIREIGFVDSAANFGKKVIESVKMIRSGLASTGPIELFYMTTAEYLVAIKLHAPYFVVGSTSRVWLDESRRSLNEWLELLHDLTKRDHEREESSRIFSPSEVDESAKRHEALRGIWNPFIGLSVRLRMRLLSGQVSLDVNVFLDQMRILVGPKFEEHLYSSHMQENFGEDWLRGLSSWIEAVYREKYTEASLSVLDERRQGDIFRIDLLQAKILQAMYVILWPENETMTKSVSLRVEEFEKLVDDFEQFGR